MVQIIPAILDTEEESFKNHIIQLNQAKSFKEGWVHIDFMDNKFVPNKSIDPLLLAKYPINLKKEAHPMVSRPLSWVDKLVMTKFNRIIFHFESDGDPSECIEYIKGNGLEAGIALNSETPIVKLKHYAAIIDTVLLMGIVPGFQEQLFIPGTFERVKEAVRFRSENSANFKIGVDGAVRDTNAKQLVEAGADYLIVGSFLLKGDMDENLKTLWEALS